jgi:hypothetical protein
MFELETAVDRFETIATIWSHERFFPLGEGRYDSPVHAPEALQLPFLG